MYASLLLALVLVPVGTFFRGFDVGVHNREVRYSWRVGVLLLRTRAFHVSLGTNCLEQRRHRILKFGKVHAETVIQ